MCRLIVGFGVKKDVVLGLASNAYNVGNRDGYGLYVDGRVVYRDIDFEGLTNTILKLSERLNTFVLHCRLASRGSVKKDNVHLFNKDGVLFAHNGTFINLGVRMCDDITDSEEWFLKNYDELKRMECNTIAKLLAEHTGNCVALIKDNTIIIGATKEIFIRANDNNNSLMIASFHDVFNDIEKEINILNKERVNVRGMFFNRKGVVKTIPLTVNFNKEFPLQTSLDYVVVKFVDGQVVEYKKIRKGVTLNYGFNM